MRNQLLRYGIALSLAMTVPAGMAFAAGGGDDAAAKCSSGKVLDKNTGKCVEKTSDVDSIYDTGRALAKAGRYGEAIVVLSKAGHSGDPRVLNYLGYSHRMQGRIEVGLGYYEEALRINPDFTLAREYMGEAYLQKGDLAGARSQLSEIEKRCGTGCSEYVELEQRISAYLKEI